ncbi:MAG: tetratricopeptide repeat protein [Flavobacteriales bacterium]|nr:tetratricopeptide repeat protein [Flavobacteriales bacterium]
MKKIILSLVLAIYSLVTYSQNQDSLDFLYENREYDKIIELYANKKEDYSSNALYQIGFAYYMKEDDPNCIKWMDLSIQKDPQQVAAYFIKASTLNYMKRYTDAIETFQSSLKNNPNDPQCLIGLGESYYQSKNLEMALQSYKKAIEQPNCPSRAFSMIGQIYSDLNDHDKALEAYYFAKSKVLKDTESYTNALFNIGLLESLKGNHAKAEPAFLEIIDMNPSDYHAYSKLIQVYYRLKEYDKAKPYKDKLYDAYKKGLLTDNLKDMFCFDQFKWNNYTVLVFERYENESKNAIYNKHIFYVQDHEGTIVFRVQTEFSRVSLELGGTKYMLCANLGDAHINSGLGFNDDFDYEVLKTQAINMMEKHLK